MEDACLTEMGDVNGEGERGSERGRDRLTNVSCEKQPIMESVGEVSIAERERRIRE